MVETDLTENFMFCRWDSKLALSDEARLRKGRVEVQEAGDYEPSLASALSAGTEASSDDGD